MKRALVVLLALLFCFGPTGSLARPLDSTAWQQIPGPLGGSVAALAMSPGYADDHTVFAGLRGRGVYRTVDSGESWQPVSPPDWVVVDLAISPAYASDHTVFAATGSSMSGYDVYRSNDEGVTWQAQTSTPHGSGFPTVIRLAISPNFASDHTLYVLGGSETYRSTDGGATFTTVGGWFASHTVTYLVFSNDFASDHTLFALATGAGIYKSIDGGTAWNPAGLLGDMSTLAISPNYATDHTLAVSASDGQLYMSIDGGVTFPTRPLTLGVGGKHTLLFSQTFATDQLMLAASSADAGAYRSTNGGASWTPVGWYNPVQSYLGGFIGGSVFVLTVAPDDSLDGNSFAGTSTGLYRSNNRGENWYQRDTGLAPLTVRSIAAAPGDPHTLLAGTSYFDHVRFDTSDLIESDGDLQLSADGGQTWQDVTGQLDRVQHVAFSPDFANDQTAFATTGLVGQHGYANGGAYRSTDGGHNWSAVLTSTVCGALAISPNYASDHTVWVSASSGPLGAGLLVSTNGGNSWSMLAATLHAQVLVPSPNFAVDHTLFAGTNDSGLQRSTDGGSHWVQLLSHAITSLTVSPVYGASRTLYAGVVETNGAPGEIYRSTDSGSSWLKLATGIPPTWQGYAADITSLSFAADGSVLAGISYVGANDGAVVYRSIDGGNSWQMFGSSSIGSMLFDSASASSLPDFDPHASLSVYAGTDGGLWRLGVLQVDPTEPGQWQSSGPRGGRAQALAISPNFVNDGVVFSGEWIDGAHGDQIGLGIFKSTDGGQMWGSSSNGLTPVPYPYSTAVHTFAFSPAFVTDTTVFAATWGGLFKSTDGGANWQWLPRASQGAPGSFTVVALAPNYPTGGHILAGSGWGGLFLSQDGGLSWTHNYSVSATAIAYSPNFATDDTVFVASAGVFSSTNRGLTWTHVLTQPALSALVVSPDFAHDRTIVAGGDALVRSVNGGATWISTTLGSHINALAISPDFANDHTVFAGTANGLYRSNNAGLSWNAVMSYTGPSILSLAISPGWPLHPVLLAGTSLGVYRTTDGGTTWTRTQGLSVLGTSPLAVSSDESLWLTGSPNHGVYASGDQGSSWSPIGLQDGSLYYSIGDVAVSPDYAHDHTLFAARNSGVGIGGSIYRTTDSGAHWSPVYSTDSVGGFAMSPDYATDHTLFAYGQNFRVISSTNGGDNWSSVGTWPAGSYAAVQRVALSPDYPTDSTIFAGGGQGFWRLPPGGTEWQPAASGLLSNTYVLAIALSPNYSTSHTLLAVAALNSAQHYQVFRSTDGGVNWQPSSTGLPDVELKYVAFSPNYAVDRIAYATSISRLYRSIDGGLSWTSIGAPPGWPALAHVSVNQAGQVFVTTSAGVWRYSSSWRDILIDGDFEAGSGWDMPLTPNPAGYSDRVVYDGLRSLRVGIDSGANLAAYSSARQTVTIPISASHALLSFRLYAASGDATLADRSRTFQSIDAIRSPLHPAAGDAQYALVVNPVSGVISQTLIWELSNAQTWTHYSFDLAPYAGQTIVLHWGVYNDGLGGRTAMYIDNASLITIGPLPYRLYLPIIRK